MKIIYILGTDGAGKTTVARRLASAPMPGHRIRYLYCQHRPLFLWLLKLPARLLFIRRTDQFKNYDQYRTRKDTVVAGQPRLTRLYALVWYCDVLLQTWPKMLWARLTGDILLMDRYYLDWVVNVGVLQHNSLEGMLRDARGLERFLPKAHVHLFLDVSEETAFRRKNDIQSVQYLRERKQRYFELAPHFGFQVVDANTDVETVFRHVHALVEAAVEPAAALNTALST